MRIERWEPADTQTLQGCLTVWQAALDVDDPDGAPMSARVLGGWLRLGWVGDPSEAWVLTTQEAGVVGFYRLQLPDLENLDRALLHVVVHPAHRRRGHGGALLRHATSRAGSVGRTVLAGEVRNGSPGDFFAARAGAKPGIGAAVRVLDLRATPAARIAGLRTAAEQSAAGYTLVSWTGPTPAEYLGRLAVAISAYEDAPQDAGVETEAWDGARVRDRGDGTVAEMGLRQYTIVAVHDASGDIAGMTQLAVDPGVPEWGHQALTAVTRPHRGHRLGLLVKTAMLQWLATAEPQVERIETGNASANRHMIAINEALGFHTHGEELHSVEVAAGGLQS